MHRPHVYFPSSMLRQLPASTSVAGTIEMSRSDVQSGRRIDAVEVGGGGVYFPATPSLDAAICVLGLSVMACVQHAVMYERSNPRQLKDISSSSASVSYRVVSFHPAWLRLDE